MVARATKANRAEAKHISKVMGEITRIVATLRRPEADINLFVDEVLVLIDKDLAIEFTSSVDWPEGKVSVLTIAPTSALLNLIDNFKGAAA